MHNLYHILRPNSPTEDILLSFFDNPKLFAQHIDFIKANKILYIDDTLLKNKHIAYFISHQLPVKIVKNRKIHIDDLFCAAIASNIIKPDSPLISQYLDNHLAQDPLKILGTILSFNEFREHFKNSLDYNVVNDNDENLLFIFKEGVSEEYHYYNKDNILNFIQYQFHLGLFNIHQLDKEGFPFFVDCNLHDTNQQQKYKEILSAVVNNNNYSEEHVKLLNSTILRRFSEILYFIPEEKFIFPDLDPYAALYGERNPSLRKIINSSYIHMDYVEAFFKFKPDGYNYVADPENPENIMHLLAKTDKEREFTILLFSKDIDLNLQNKDGDTPIHLLVKEFNSDIKNMPFISQIAYIINSDKCDLSLKNKEGLTVKDIIFSIPDSPLVKIYAELEKKILLSSVDLSIKNSDYKIEKKRI